MAAAVKKKKPATPRKKQTKKETPAPVAPTRARARPESPARVGK